MQTNWVTFKNLKDIYYSFLMITRNLQIVPKNPNIDDTHFGRWSLGSYKIKMKKNLSLIKFNSEKNSARKLRKCEMELAAILLQLCAIFGHTRHGIFIWGKSTIFFQTKFLSEEFICWIWKNIFLCQSFTWFVSDRNNLNNLRISKSKKTSG